MTGDDSISLIEEAASETQDMIENVEFVVVVRGDEADQLKADIAERELPITVAVIENVEPIVDLIERSWACVTVPGRGLPYGLAMFALSAGVPLISLGELDGDHGFENHLNYIGIEDEPDAVAYALQLLHRWTTWSLRIGIAGQKLVEERYSTRSVAIKEGEQLARIARGEELESNALPKEAKVLRTFVSPAEGEVPELFTKAAAEVEAEEAEDQYSAPGFDLVTAALADISVSKPSESPELETTTSDSVDLGQDAISALFAAGNDDPEPESTAEPEEAAPAGDLGQDAISALFSANDEWESDTTAEQPEQAVISALVEAKQKTAETFTPSDDESEDDLPEVNLVNFNADDGLEAEPYPLDPDLDDVDEDLIASMLELKDEDPAA